MKEIEIELNKMIKVDEGTYIDSTKLHYLINDMQAFMKFNRKNCNLALNVQEVELLIQYIALLREYGWDENGNKLRIKILNRDEHIKQLKEEISLLKRENKALSIEGEEKCERLEQQEKQIDKLCEWLRYIYRHSQIGCDYCPFDGNCDSRCEIPYNWKEWSKQNE